MEGNGISMIVKAKVRFAACLHMILFFSLTSKACGFVISQRYHSGANFHSYHTITSRRKAGFPSWRADFNVFFDLMTGSQSAGRMVFRISEASLPKIVENFRQLVSGERRSVDPMLSYEGCYFEYGPAYVQGTGNYKWSHVCKGRGRNVFGRDKISEPEALVRCRHTCPGPTGGSYYGMRVELDDEEDVPGSELHIDVSLMKPLGLVLEEETEGTGVFVASIAAGSNAAMSGQVLPGDRIAAVSGQDCAGGTLDSVMSSIAAAPLPVRLRLLRPPAAADGDTPAAAAGTVLTVPVGGPGCGLARFDIVRVSDSPSSWQQRLLLNQAVIGRMVSGRGALLAMANAAAPAKIARCGVLPGPE